LLDTNEIIKANQAKDAFVAGALETWANMLEIEPEMQSSVIKDMREMVSFLKKSAGLVNLKDD